MAKKRLTKAEADRVIQVSAAAAHCLQRMRLMGKKLTARQQARLKACVLDLVGPKKITR